MHRTILVSHRDVPGHELHRIVSVMMARVEATYRSHRGPDHVADICVPDPPLFLFFSHLGTFVRMMPKRSNCRIIPAEGRHEHTNFIQC